MSFAGRFDLNKYLGTWYELIHYPSWFQRNDNYNTKAEYSLNPDGTINVHNSTITQGKPFDSIGTAKKVGDYSLRVDFPIPEVAKLQLSQEFKPPSGYLDQSGPNYVVDMIWTNYCGEYIFAVVTDPTKQSLYLLSRFQHPSLIAYNQVMEYIVANYDRDRLVQTPHFD